MNKTEVELRRVWRRSKVKDKQETASLLSSSLPVWTLQEVRRWTRLLFCKPAA